MQEVTGGGVEETAAAGGTHALGRSDSDRVVGEFGEGSGERDVLEGDGREVGLEEGRSFC